MRDPPRMVAYQRTDASPGGPVSCSWAAKRDGRDWMRPGIGPVLGRQREMEAMQFMLTAHLPLEGIPYLRPPLPDPKSSTELLVKRDGSSVQFSSVP